MNTDRNLLFGVLALQADLLDQARFVEACVAWTAQKDRPLAELLLEHGWITPADQQVIEHLLELKLKKHGGDPHASLADALDDRARSCLSALGDPDVRATLDKLPQPSGHVLVSTMDYAPGTRERYTLSRLHAKGGIGQVWLARDETLGREVALKELRPERAANPTVWARFLEEARITGQLEHPGIVPVYELSPPSGDRQPFYTMRFVRGRTLADAIREHHRRRSAGEAGAIEFRGLLQALVGVCHAVAYAHSRGVIHRDLKPQNVVLGDYGEVIVLDWGLAKLVGRPEDTHSPPVAVEHPEGRSETAAGQVLGTPAYMAPEQAEGRWEAVDRHSDIYGLGAILYEILSGRPPFVVDDTLELLRRVVQEEPERPRQHNPGAPRALEAVCLKAMAKRPAERYDTAGEMEREVQRFLADEPVSAWREPVAVRTRRWLGRHRTLMTASVAAALVALMGLATILAVQARANQQLRDANGRLADANRRVTRASADLQVAHAQVQARYELAMDAIKTYHTGVSEEFLLKEPKFHALRDRLLSSATDFYGQLGAMLGRQSDPASRRAVAQANFEVAALTARVGRKEAALVIHRRVLADREALAREQSSVDELQADVAVSLLDVGRLLAETGRADEGLANYERARASLQKLTDHHPTVVRYRDAPARAHHYTGDLHFGEGRYAEGAEAHERALEIWKALAIASSDTARFRNDQARSELYRGANLWMIGRTAEAQASMERAAAVLQELADKNPTVAQFWIDLAKSYNNLGILLYQTDRPTDALATWERARVIRQKLADDNPAVTQFQSDLARINTHIGIQLGETGRTAEAVEAHGRAVAILQRLVDDNPAVTDLQRDLSNGLNEAGDVLRLVGRTAEAQASYERGVVILEGLIKANPPATKEQGWLVQGLKGLGVTQLAAGQTAEAVASWRRSVAIGERLRSDFGETLYYLACCHALLGGAAGVPGAGLSAEEGQAELGRAVDVLHRVVAAGYRNVTRMQRDPDLDPLRSHTDFKLLVMDLVFPVQPFARGD